MRQHSLYDTGTDPSCSQTFIIQSWLSLPLKIFRGNGTADKEQGPLCEVLERARPKERRLSRHDRPCSIPCMIREGSFLFLCCILSNHTRGILHPTTKAQLSLFSWCMVSYYKNTVRIHREGRVKNHLTAEPNAVETKPWSAPEFISSYWLDLLCVGIFSPPASVAASSDGAILALAFSRCFPK